MPVSQGLPSASLARISISMGRIRHPDAMLEEPLNGLNQDIVF